MNDWRNPLAGTARHALLWVLLLAWVAASVAAEFAVDRAAARLVDGVYLVDAQIDYQFSETALEALENGVPLTVEVHIQVRRDKAWIWEADVVDLRFRLGIRYHPLSSLYQVSDLSSGATRSFATRDAALQALGEIEGLPVVADSQLEAGERYEVRLAAALDIEALPLPLRPLAYVSPSWNLSSDTSRWQLRP